MDKQEFLAQLRRGLSGLPRSEAEERLTFYSEMIEDRMEEGLSEEAAVVAVGSVEEIVAQILADTPITKPSKERIRPEKRLGVWTVLLLVLGSPIWLSLGISAAAVAISLYISLWAVLVSLWAVAGSLAVCSVSGALACVILFVYGHGVAGAALLAGSVVCAGLAVLMFLGSKAATVGALVLTKKMAIRMKKRFIRKGTAE